MSKKVAIVGSGCSGIGALWALKQTSHEVHLFEADARLGGHTNTVTFKGKDGDETQVDTGFIVMNTATYPNFIRFLNHIGVLTRKTEMSFGVTRDCGLFEWAGKSLGAIFAQRFSFLSPRRWRLIFDIIRFNQFALDVIIHEHESDVRPTKGGRDAGPSYAQMSIGEYLDRQGYSQTFKDDYLIPMTAMVWSTTPDKCSLEFPALTLIRFMWNHHLLNTITDRPDWLTIPGGSRQYIETVLKGFPESRIHLDTKVTAVEPEIKGMVKLRANGEDLLFDHVILATHGDQAREIMGAAATPEEERILDGFETSHNIAVLHSDLNLMPRREITWSAWNFVTESPLRFNGRSNVSKICLTYWMNLLQHIDQSRFGPVLVTLNPLHPPNPTLTQGVWEYTHPLYNSRAIQSQKELPKIQNKRGVSYCGAWTKYGFHEDGFSSGLAAAQDHLGATLPFDFVDSTFSRGQRPVLTLKNYIARVVIGFIQLLIMLVEYPLEKWNWDRRRPRI